VELETVGVEVTDLAVVSAPIGTEAETEAPPSIIVIAHKIAIIDLFLEHIIFLFFCFFILDSFNI